MTTSVHMHTDSFQVLLSMKLCCADDCPLKTRLQLQQMLTTKAYFQDLKYAILW